MSGHLKKRAVTWKDKFNLGGDQSQNKNWKDVFVVLTNFGVFEFAMRNLEDPKHLY